MTAQNDLDRALGAWFHGDAIAAPPEPLARVIESTRTIRPRPALTARVGSHWVVVRRVAVRGLAAFSRLAAARSSACSWPSSEPPCWSAVGWRPQEHPRTRTSIELVRHRLPMRRRIRHSCPSWTAESWSSATTGTAAARAPGHWSTTRPPASRADRPTRVRRFGVVARASGAAERRTGPGHRGYRPQRRDPGLRPEHSAIYVGRPDGHSPQRGCGRAPSRWTRADRRRDPVGSGWRDEFGRALRPGHATSSPTGSMGTTRSGASMAVLPDGRVFVSPGESRTTVEFYDPRTGTFSAAGTMASYFHGNTAIALPDGRVAVLGGSSLSGQGFAEVWDPISLTFSPGCRPRPCPVLAPDGGMMAAESDLPGRDQRDPP